MTQTTPSQPATPEPNLSETPPLAVQIRQSRMLFLAMATAYTLGNFNDNFMKQSVSLLALTHHHAGLQGWVATLFTIPFLLFTAAAGWMADRFPRRRIIIISKFMELAFLSMAAYGVLTLNWPVLIAVILLMAVQATIFGPALTGSIPDIYPESFVVHANARLKAAITGAILIGVIAAGLSLNVGGHWHGVAVGRVIVASILVTVALIGVIVSFGVPRRPAGNPDASFPWGGPLNSMRDLWSLRKDRLLITAILGDSYFWFLAALQVLFINKMGIEQFHLDYATTSYLALAELLGVVAGSLIAGKIIARDHGLWTAPPATAALAIFMCLTGAAALLAGWQQLAYVLTMLALCGVAGGMMMVPLESFFQTRPAAEHRGQVIAAAWFAGFMGILLGSMAYIPLQKWVQPTTVFLMVGVLTFPVAALMAPVFSRRRPSRASWQAKLLCLVARIALSTRYRVKISGQPPAGRPANGILFLANHPALIDPVIVTAWLHGKFGLRPLALESQIYKPVIRSLADMIGVIPIPDMDKVDRDNALRADAAIAQCIDALKRGENVLLYPAGRLMRQRQETLGGVSAAHRIVAELPDVRIVILHTTGLWGSCFGWGTGQPPRLSNGARRIPALLLSGLWFGPKRPIHIELTEPANIPRTAPRLTFNAYLDKYLNGDAPPARYVPYSIWERTGPHDLPEPSLKQSNAAIDVPSATRTIVLDYLQQLTGQANITETQNLTTDLGLDSLSVTEIILWIEKEFGVSLPNVEAVQTVGDVMMAAINKLSVEGHDVQASPPPANWWAHAPAHRAVLAPADTIGQAFLAQVLQAPHRAVAADIQRGTRTYRQLLTAVLALRDPIAAVDGQYVGIMLPASVAADVAYLAVLFAGKTPVMLNWTTGSRQMQHGLDLLGIRRVLTANALLQRLSAQGIDLSTVADRFLPLERIGAELTRWQKLSAALRARRPRSIKLTGSAGDTAAVLFTSGSESLPKAVPLTHQNILTNIGDALNSFTIMQSDRMLGMLPPFHSFGLTGTSLLPLLSGVRVVHHPNPAEVAALGAIIDSYHVSILLGTPTFVGNIIRGRADHDFGSVRLCVMGAEKCPSEIYETVQKVCPKAAVLEGYGITECSPIVSITRQEDPAPGTIGVPLPSVETAIIHPETHQPVKPGETGMLLVRGPSIFGGYLHYDGPSPFETFNNKSWYRTGDLVRLDDASRLVFAGRLKRFVKIGGEMVSLPAIEEVLLRHLAHPDDKGPPLAVVATRDEQRPELVLFCIRPVERSHVNQLIRAAGLSGLHNIRQVRIINEIPILGTGKTDYRKLEQSM